MIHKEDESQRLVIDIVMQYNDGYSETIFTFANNINTIEGGTHLSGFKSCADADDQLLRQERQAGQGRRGRALGR